MEKYASVSSSEAINIDSNEWDITYHANLTLFTNLFKSDWKDISQCEVWCIMFLQCDFKIYIII